MHRPLFRANCSIAIIMFFIYKTKMLKINLNGHGTLFFAVLVLTSLQNAYAWIPGDRVQYQKAVLWNR